MKSDLIGEMDKIKEEITQNLPVTKFAGYQIWKTTRGSTACRSETSASYANSCMVSTGYYCAVTCQDTGGVGNSILYTHYYYPPVKYTEVSNYTKYTISGTGFLEGFCPKGYTRNGNLCFKL